MSPWKLRAIDVANRLDVDKSMITELILGDRRITPHSAMLLSHLFGTPPNFWMDLQNEHDFWKLERDREIPWPTYIADSTDIKLGRVRKQNV